MTTGLEEQVQQSNVSSSQCQVLEPDLDFIKDIASLGGESFKKCYQCATCSATCPISPDDKPFPRKEMVWSIWGWKDQLLKDPDVWLCHQCNDCSAVCPREGNPGDILAVVRKSSYKYYAVPQFMGTLLYEPKFLPVVLGLPIVILLVVVGLWGNFTPDVTDGIVFKNFLPHPWPLDFLFSFFAIFATIVAFISGKKFLDALAQGPRPPVPDAKGLVGGAVDAVKEIISHSQFNECDKANPRYYSHLLTFYGFIALFITTGLVFMGLYLLGLETPLSLLHPFKILGNLGAVAFLIGTGWMLYDRLTDEEKSGKSTYNDWLFIGLMFGLALSGILTEVVRLAGIAPVAYGMYFVHLVLILSMMAYFPYSKFAHMLYRFLAISYYHGCATSQSQSSAAIAPVETSPEPEPEKEPEAA